MKQSTFYKYGHALQMLQLMMNFFFIIIQMTVLTSSYSTIKTKKSNIAIIGGGLAGLSTTFHILQKQSKTKITIFDSSSRPGLGGASSVAAGLLHPFSPKGKIVYKGKEALQIANELISRASCYDDNDDDDDTSATVITKKSNQMKRKKKTILRDTIYRPIFKPSDMELFEKTIDSFPEYISWLSDDEFTSIQSNNNIQQALSCVKYINGCKVIHVPTYLQGLWKECISICSSSVSSSTTNDSNNSIAWKKQQITPSILKDISNEYDIVILTAGAGLFEKNLLEPIEDYPITLVRGQALEVQFPSSSSDDDNDNGNGNTQQEAILCGKYITPTPISNRMIIGATHEFKKDALDLNNVIEELKRQTYQLNPNIWDDTDNKMIICDVLSGIRVQSNRSAFGRLPIFGKVLTATTSTRDINNNMWYFTGLSSRGVLYHGLYGKELVDQIFDS